MSTDKKREKESDSESRDVPFRTYGRCRTGATTPHSRPCSCFFLFGSCLLASPRQRRLSRPFLAKKQAQSQNQARRKIKNKCTLRSPCNGGKATDFGTVERGPSGSERGRSEEHT